MTDDAVNLTPRETDILAARLIAKHIVNDSPAVVLWEDVPELSEQASGCSSRTVPCIPTHPRLKGEPVADQTPDPIDVIAGAVGGMLGHGYEPEIAKVALEALKAAGLQVTPIPDAETLAQRFHEAYERLAPEYGYETRPDSAVPWNDVPEQNRALMVAVCREMALPIPDADTRQEVETLIEGQVPHVCRSCGGTGWIDDDGWSDERWSLGLIEREEGEGLIPCGACGDWHIYRDEYSEPTTILDGWTSEQECRAAELLAAAYLGRTD